VILKTFQKTECKDKKKRALPKIKIIIFALHLKGHKTRI